VSPQSVAVTSPPPLGDETIRILDFGPPVRRRIAVAPETELLRTLEINPAPAFEQPVPLQLVPRGTARGRRDGQLQGRPTRAAEPRALRLTRRGRVVLVLIAAACLLFGFSIGNDVSLASTPTLVPAASSSALAQTAAAAAQPGARSLYVQPGQTLWAIALQLAPHTDPRVTVQRIIAANHLANADVQAGEQLVLPS
jgi:LysM domain